MNAKWLLDEFTLALIGDLGVNWARIPCRPSGQHHASSGCNSVAVARDSWLNKKGMPCPAAATDAQAPRTIVDKLQRLVNVATSLNHTRSTIVYRIFYMTSCTGCMFLSDSSTVSTLLLIGVCSPQYMREWCIPLTLIGDNWPPDH